MCDAPLAREDDPAEGNGDKFRRRSRAGQIPCNLGRGSRIDSTMVRRPTRIFALLLVLWVVIVVIVPTIDLPNTTLPARSALCISGLLAIAAAGLLILRVLDVGARFLGLSEEVLGSRSRDVINMTCSRLC